MRDDFDEDEYLEDSEEGEEELIDENGDLLETSDYVPSDESVSVRHLPGMYRTWYLEYASYVILERAVPNLRDGLKPVQRRVLYTMQRMEDGRYNKVANIVGETMKFHPHGDASIYEALVVLGQKNLLIDHQGNWGNILTGDAAAAARYIEARLSKFALEAVFNDKTTAWKPSYDGRNKEPVWLPVKFPLLLAQGTLGIGVGLNSVILPHNFNELSDAAIAYLRGESFELYPDLPTGGLIDVSSYREGARGGRVKIRAKIEKRDNRTLVITEGIFGETTEKLIASIIAANDQGKINIRKIDDNTAEKVEIVLHLDAKVSSDKTIDALYACTDCEFKIYPNCCVVYNNKPQFITVSELLRTSTDNTRELLQRELQIQQAELEEQWHWISLEKIFFENRIYKTLEQDAASWEAQLKAIERAFDPYRKQLSRAITRDDVLKLCEKPVRKISKFDIKKAEEDLSHIEQKLDQVRNNLEHLTDYTIQWFKYLKKTYGAQYMRHSEIRSFETIEASKVVAANAKLYVNTQEGFIGIGLKRDDNVEFVSDCSDIDDIIIFFRDGRYRVQKIADKAYVGPDIMHVAVFLRNDQRTIYNAIYRDGRTGPCYMKRFAVNAVVRDKDYDLTQGTEGSRVLYFSANPNGEAETVRVSLKITNMRRRNNVIEMDFSHLSVKGRQARGNLLTRHPVQRIVMKERGGSTLGGTKIWIDTDVMRLNMEERGTYLGEFFNEDQILVITRNGTFYTTNFELTNHYEDDVLLIEKFDPQKTWTAVLIDADQGKPYLKRFKIEPSEKRQSFIGDNVQSQLLLVTDTSYPRLQVTFGGSADFRQPIEVDAEQFVGIKSFKARGKRLTNYELEAVKELEPLRHPQDTTSPLHDKTPNAKSGEPYDVNAPAVTTVIYDAEHPKSDGQADDNRPNVDPLTGQINLF